MDKSESLPAVSVVMSVYKEPIEWMCLSIDSILQQTFSDFEFIIVNDCPERDDNHKVLSDYQLRDHRITIITNEENLGLTKSLNRGLTLARGKYIARMDADDIATEDRFQIQVDYLEKNPHVDLCHSAFEQIDDAGVHTGDRILNAREKQAVYLFLLDPIAHPSVMFCRHVLKTRTPLYNEEYRNAQDYELWSSLYLKGATFGYIEKKLLRYRLSKSQITRKESGTQEDNGRRIRRVLIYNYLIQKGCILEPSFTATEVLDGLKNTSIIFDDIKIKYYVKFLAYFTCARYKGKRFALYYLLDRDLLFSKLPIYYSLYVLFSSVLKDKWKLMEM